MKMRSKTMSLLAVAAALALLAGVAALAAGRLGAPRPDNVTLGQPVSETTPTAEPTTEPTAEVSDDLIVPTEEDSATVYCTKGGRYYHSVSDCSGMENAQTTTQREAQVMGKFRCQVCNAAEPESYDVFLKVFGHPLSTLFPGFQYERSQSFDTNLDGAVDLVEWYVSDGKQEQLACRLGYSAHYGAQQLTSFMFNFDEFNYAGISENFIQLVPDPLHTALAACRKRLPTAPDWLSIGLDEDYNVKGGIATCFGSEDQNGSRPQTGSVQWLQTPDGEIRILKSDYGPDGFDLEEDTEEILQAPTAAPCYTTQEGTYYHSVSDCSGMQNAQTTTQSAAQAMGKQPCPVCMGEQNEAAIDGELSNLAAQPESYDVFLKVFGHPLSTFFSGFEFERSEAMQTRPDGFVEAVDWYVSDGKQEQLACTACYLDYDGVRKASQFDLDFRQFRSAGVSENFIQLVPEPLHTALAACQKRLPTAPDYLTILLDEDYNVRGGGATCWGSEDQNGFTPQTGSVQWLQNPDGEIRILKPNYMADGTFVLEDDTEEILQAPTAAPCYTTQDDAYYHSRSDCSGMQDALSTSEREAQAMGKFRCQVCNAAEPESYDVFQKVFGHPLSTFFPGCEYERSESSDFNSDGVADAVDWYVSDGKQEQLACRLDYGSRYGPQQLYRFIFEFGEFNDASVSANFIHFSSEPLHTALEACRKRLPAAPDWLTIVLDEDYNVKSGIASCFGIEYQYETQAQVRSDVQWMQTPDGEIRILKSDYGPDGFDLEEDTEEILQAPTGEDSIAEEDKLSF